MERIGEYKHLYRRDTKNGWIHFDGGFSQVYAFPKWAWKVMCYMKDDPEYDYDLELLIQTLWELSQEDDDPVESFYDVMLLEIHQYAAEHFTRKNGAMNDNVPNIFSEQLYSKYFRVYPDIKTEFNKVVS